MPTISIVLSIASILVLLGGIWAWRLTSSQRLLINVVLSSAFLLIGAYAATRHERPEFTFILPFFATMVLGGRAVGLMWRSRKEEALLAPGLLLTGCTALCGAGSVMAYYTQ